jgi:hypothetical protein
MTNKGKELKVWFSGGTEPRPVRGDGCFVGAAGELKIYVGHTVTVIIAPGAWTFVEVAS